MGRKKNKNKNRAQPYLRSQSEPASTDPRGIEKGNTICYICDKRFICPCEREGCTKPKERTCALASYSNTYLMSRLLPTNDGCYLVHACSDSCARQINEQSNAYYRSKNIIFKKADDDHCCSYIPDKAIDAFKARNENPRHRVEKKGNNFEAMFFDMMNNAIEEACRDRLEKHLSANK
ncbi:unnamed protein product [Rhizophagus irregularis]|uniref:Uncharacterized protein n=1 Tax=Rhizophagus irregularis TaxID=588596 RepID=A0A2N1ME57_9GLOM|nr:hypothetical protein RhiirC2_794118 [Rhizophagus irregularis]CAB4387897.1 unnamed protein product [Rhizophagus irregularis]CAB5381251.1 unnamed protein product [Rhizophagus irregularis]